MCPLHQPTGVRRTLFAGDTVPLCELCWRRNFTEKQKARIYAAGERRASTLGVDTRKLGYRQDGRLEKGGWSQFVRGGLPGKRR